MYLNFHTFHKLRIITAVIVLILALIYLNGGEKIALIGFALMSTVVAIICNKIRKGIMPAVCDLCGTKATLQAEYGAGFSNARLVLNCPCCGRVVNQAKQGVNPQRERENNKN